MNKDVVFGNVFTWCLYGILLARSFTDWYFDGIPVNRLIVTVAMGLIMLAYHIFERERLAHNREMLKKIQKEVAEARAEQEAHDKMDITYKL